MRPSEERLQHTGHGTAAKGPEDSASQTSAAIPSRKRLTLHRSHAIQIEKKLDGLMSLLNASHQLSPNTLASALTSGPTVASATPSTADGALPHPVRLLYQTSSRPEPEGPLQNPSFSSAIDETFGEREADKLVDIYRNDLMMQSPFVAVPTDLSAQELKQTKPFLFHSILMAASYKNVARQKLLEGEIVKYLSENLLLKGERNFDLLQGLLVYIAWYVV